MYKFISLFNIIRVPKRQNTRQNIQSDHAYERMHTGRHCCCMVLLETRMRRAQSERANSNYLQKDSFFPNLLYTFIHCEDIPVTLLQVPNEWLNFLAALYINHSKGEANFLCVEPLLSPLMNKLPFNRLFRLDNWSYLL